MKSKSLAGMSGDRDLRGFTLVEIMIVVAIIGLLAAIAIPSFIEARNSSKVRAVANDLRVFSEAFEIYAMDNNAFPYEGVNLGELPPGLEDYISADKFAAPTPLGGRYYYKATKWGAFNYAPAIGCYNVSIKQSYMIKLDELIDNGNLASGSFQVLGLNSYYVVMDE